MSDVDVSVIMPVHDAGQYLEPAIRSVLAQDHPSFELILVDDGSSDGSAQVCDRAAERDLRVRVLHTSNHGQGHARNLGIDVAHGEFVMFCDHDDVCLPGFIAENHALAVINGVDCVRFGHMQLKVSAEGEVLRYNPCVPSHACVLAREDYPRHVREYYYASGVWSGLYRRSVLRGDEGQRITFVEGLRHGYEDVLFNDDVYRVARAVCFNPHALYVWKQREGQSASTILDENHLQGIRMTLAAQSAFFEEPGAADANPSFCANLLASYVLARFAGMYSSPDRAKVSSEIREARELLAPYEGFFQRHRPTGRGLLLYHMLRHGNERLLFGALYAGMTARKTIGRVRSLLSGRHSGRVG